MIASESRQVNRLDHGLQVETGRIPVLLRCSQLRRQGRDRQRLPAIPGGFRNDGYRHGRSRIVVSLELRVGSPFAGWLADRVSRSRVVVLSLAAWSLVTFATGFAASVDQLLATRVLRGAAACFYLPASIALIADHHPTNTRATAIGIHTAGLYIGLVAGGWASGYLGAHFGWQSSFRVLGSCGVALAIGSYFWLKDGSSSRERKSFEWTEIAALLKTRTYLILLLEAMLVAVIGISRRSTNSYRVCNPLRFALVRRESNGFVGNEREWPGGTRPT
jgi:MFS family permease